MKQPSMIAKFLLVSCAVVGSQPPQEKLVFSAVTEKPFDETGVSEDNTFAKWTPGAELTMNITNPELIGKFSAGKKFYAQFTPADEEAEEEQVNDSLPQDEIVLPPPADDSQPPAETVTETAPAPVDEQPAPTA